MKRFHFFAITLLSVFLIGAIGCGSKVKKQDPNAAKGHKHAEGDELVWVKKDLEHGEYKISLGHHGKDFHFGDEIEAAVMITKDGKDVEGLEVSNCMLDEDKKVLVKDRKLVFEPKTDEEPAHYAQAEMQIPEGAEHFVI